jgi:hypothetical protein
VRVDGSFDVAITSPFSEEGYHEAKIVTRFVIVGIILAILTIEDI